jgi:hypothetical protein
MKIRDMHGAKVKIKNKINKFKKIENLPLFTSVRQNYCDSTINDNSPQLTLNISTVLFL